MRMHGPAYIERHAAALLPGHARALMSIVRCRTPAAGGHVAVCPQCGVEHLLYHSCRHRACPRCGHDAATRWLAGQRELLLPVTYFHVVFTLPAELRRLVRSHQKTLVPLLFRAAFESLSRLAADPHYLGARIGALAVLHTWTRTLEWHPHIHMLVPGGGIGPDGRSWCAIPPRRRLYFVPVKALARLFRGRFLHLVRQALPSVAIPQVPFSKNWVVFAKPTVQGADKVLAYLGRYVHRTAISDSSIVGCDDNSVSFGYRDSRDQCRKTMTLSGQEFLRRFLQHVPPHGLHRVRAFGLLHPAHRPTLRRLQLLLQPRTDPSAAPPIARPRPRCPYCAHTELLTLATLSPTECIALAAANHPWTTSPARAPP
ncbi:MAG: IS91 family transposase [Polyangiaceae bacterium]